MQPSATRHRTGQPTLRTSVRPNSVWPPLMTAGALEFARGLLGRHAGRSRGLPALDQAVRRLMGVTMLRPVNQRTDILLAPKLSLTVRTSIQIPGQMSAAQSSTPVNGRAGTKPVAPQAMVLRLAGQATDRREPVSPTGLATAIRLVQRLAARQQRIESIRLTPESNYSSGGDPLTSLRNGHATGQPVPLVIHRTLPMTESAHELPRNDHNDIQQPEQSLRSWQPPHSLPATQVAPVNLNDLTDHVVAAIDRRMTAHRERIGRG